MLASASASAQWHHEKLVSGYGQPWFNGINVEDTLVLVNSSGVASFAVQGGPHVPSEVFRGSESLSREVGNVGGLSEGLNERGDVAWRSNRHIYVNREVISHGIIPETGGGFDTAIYGMMRDSRPLWALGWDAALQKEPDLFVGTENLGVSSLLGTKRSFDRAQTTEGEFFMWQGQGSLTGGNQHVFRNRFDLTKSVLGSGGIGYGGAINNHGDIAWTGWTDRNNGFPTFAFVNDRNISTPIMGTDRRVMAGTVQINDAGTVAWIAKGPTTGFYWDMFLGATNLSSSIYGQAEHQASTAVLNQRGTLLWSCYGDLGDGLAWDQFLGMRNLTSWLGRGRYTQLIGIDEHDRAVWSGFGPTIGNRSRLYVNDFGLSEDALGAGTNLDSLGMAVGPNGHVLWCTRDANLRYDVWLSRPVPEPTSTYPLLLASIAGIACLRPCRKRRERRSRVGRRCILP